MEFYCGGTGKNHSWFLVSDCPFVIQDKKKKEFIAVPTVEEAAKYYESDATYTVYAWSGGLWNEVHFLAISGKPSKSIGFQPGSKPN